ncbi:MAG: alpha-L-fucosidase [Bacteroidales bacterium]|nr:alpha-L-fucosidase [Bacteroidales bacterium]
MTKINYLSFENTLRYSILLIFQTLVIYNISAQSLEDYQREYTDLRFGAFFHFGIRTFTGGAWAEPDQDVNAFNPTSLDCGQWADALVAANMKFGILTTKHHDGFCLWDSEYTDNDVASSPWKGGNGDVVREYVDSFRVRELEPSLYYSVWDNTADIGNGPINESEMDVIKGQITELLSNYGEIGLLFIDGWSWKMGHLEVPYDEIRSLVKTLQPNCLLVDNTHLPCLYHNDMLHYEAGGEIPEGNTFPALLSLLIYIEGGNSWFWADDIPTANLMSTNSIVNTLNDLELQWVTFILNTPPNDDGLMDDNIVDRLQDVGENWSSDEERPPLPAQQPQLIEPVTPVTATATSGSAYNAIDGLNDRYYYTVWESNSSLPQSVTIDMRESYPDISILAYVPKYIPYITPLEEGSIEEFRIQISTDNSNWTTVKEGTWSGDVSMKTEVWEPVEARYVRLEAISGVNGFGAATEIAIGRGDYYPPTGIHGQELVNRDILLYPNPASEQFNIISYESFDNYKLINLNGKVVMNDKFTVCIDIIDIADGIYILKLAKQNGGFSYSKIVIRH